MNPSHFVIGELYAHNTIMAELRIGNSGGVRVALNKKKEVSRVVLFTAADHDSNSQDNPYLDQSDGRILTYTGTGKIGHQNLTGANLRITQQSSGYFPIYVFSLLSHRKSAGSPEKRWRFTGVFKYVNHQRQEQTDLLGSAREAWVFKLLKLPTALAHPNIEKQISEEIREAYSNPDKADEPSLADGFCFDPREIQNLIERMSNLEPFAFENFVKKALMASDFREVRVTKKSGDGGIDVIARMPFTLWPIQAQTIQVQAKRWQRSVGRREVAELRGSLMPKSLGVMITTGNYSKTAILEAEKPNQMPISLVDGYRLAVVGLRLKISPD